MFFVVLYRLKIIDYLESIQIKHEKVKLECDFRQRLFLYFRTLLKHLRDKWELPTQNSEEPRFIKLYKIY